MKYAPIALFLAGATVFGSAAHAAPNDCNAKVKLVKSQRAPNPSSTWQFEFDVTTSCEASTGMFEYEYRIKGQGDRVTVNRSPSWTASDYKKGTKNLSLTVDINLHPSHEAVFVRVVPDSITSTKTSKTQ